MRVPAPHPIAGRGISTRASVQNARNFMFIRVVAGKEYVLDLGFDAAPKVEKKGWLVTHRFADLISRTPPPTCPRSLHEPAPWKKTYETTQLR